MMSECCLCKKKYGTYPVILSGTLAGYAIEKAVRDIYYNEIDGKHIGLCEGCREKELYNNPVRMIRLLLVAKSSLWVFESGKKGDELKKIKEAVKIIAKREKELEKTPEVKELYRKNRCEAMIDNLGGWEDPIYR